MQISYDSRILEILKYGPVLGHKRIPRLKIGKILHEFSFFIISKLVRLEIIRDITGREIIMNSLNHRGYMTVSAIKRVMRRCQKQTDMTFN